MIIMTHKLLGVFLYERESIQPVSPYGAQRHTQSQHLPDLISINAPVGCWQSCRTTHHMGTMRHIENKHERYVRQRMSDSTTLPQTYAGISDKGRT